VNILHWHAVARWTWGDDVDGDVSASSARESKNASHRSINAGVASASSPSRAARPASCILGMVPRWSGASAATRSTCNVFRSGFKQKTRAVFVEGTGSSRATPRTAPTRTRPRILRPPRRRRPRRPTRTRIWRGRLTTMGEGLSRRSSSQSASLTARLGGPLRRAPVDLGRCLYCCDECHRCGRHLRRALSRAS
jgi:hypothetical protein